ncbi:hypothetical protein QBC36DRAFT_183746 [Triangularia setosa]|uniref:Uncharacterized protein n=1 Tax=Triangularia setosa TaxID=2587417 RepID=A0AAN7A969_9PEZI|nr:hypothetical protein QBC36DRAFT_183746 [Podospora setosa]
MCHQAIVILRCGHKSENLSSFDKCRHLLKLQRDEDNKTRLFSRRKKLTNCGNVTTDCRRDDSRVCGACYDKQKQELRAQREREQRAEAKRNEQKSEILRSRVEYDSRERERQQQVEAERQKGMQRDAWRRKAEQEDDQRKRERRAQTQLPVRQRGPQRPVQVVSPIPMHFAQAASVHGGSPSMDWSEPYYAPGPYRRPVDLVDDIVNMYHQRSPTIDISEPFNPGFQQANTANPNLNRNPERHIGLGIHVPSSSQQSSGLRRYYGRPSCLSEHVLEKARAKQSRIPSPPRRKVAFTDTARLTRSKSTKSKASASSSLSGKSKASRPAPVPQGPNPVVAHLQASTDKQHKPTNNSASSLTSIRNVLSRFTSRSNFRGRATPSPLGKLSGMTQRVSGTFNALAGQKSPSPEWVCYDAREIERQARQSLMK